MNLRVRMVHDFSAMAPPARARPRGRPAPGYTRPARRPPPAMAGGSGREGWGGGGVGGRWWAAAARWWAPAAGAVCRHVRREGLVTTSRQSRGRGGT